MRMRSVGFSGLVLFMAVLGPVVAQAGLVSYTADVSDGPGYQRPLTGDPPTSLSGVGTNNFFDAQPFYVDLTGVYRMEVVANLSGATDSYLILYENSFDPANPLGNALAADDDGAGFPFSRIDHMLTAGTNYILVTSTFSNNVLASYTNEIDGQGNINFGSTSAVPEPSSVVLLGIGGIALAGCGWRRKRRATA